MNSRGIPQKSSIIKKSSNKSTRQIISTIRLTSDRKKKSSSNQATHNLSNFEVKQDISKKSEQYSQRTTKENKIHHTKKHSEIPQSKEINFKSRGNYTFTDDKKPNSLRKEKNNSVLYAEQESPEIKKSFTHYNDGTNLFNENKQLRQLVHVLSYYIKNLNDEFEKRIKKIFKTKDELITKLKTENGFLINQNNSLKLKILEVFYFSKIYELNEVERNKKNEEFLSQLYEENNYLRKANLNTASLSNNNIQIEKSKAQDFPEEEKPKENEKEPVNPLQAKAKHKRQRTHFNLNSLEAEKEEVTQKNPTLTSNSSASVTTAVNVESDAFDNTLKDLNEMTITMRRNNDSKKNILEDVSGYVSPTSSQNLSNKKQQQLFYRTPRGKERKKIEFTK